MKFNEWGNRMKNKFNNQFYKSITALASGSIIAQVITFIASPIMTRIYTSDEIGEYTLILTVVTMFGSVICGKYDMSIVPEEKEERVFPLVKLSFIICLTLSLLISIAYGIYSLGDSKSSISILSASIFIFVLLFSTGIGNILLSYNNRNKEYKLMTSVNVFRTLGNCISMIVLGLLKFKSTGLLIAQIIGQMLGMNRQAKSIKPYLRDILKVDKKNMIAAAKKHYKQPMYSMPATFFNSFSYSSINIFINSLFGKSVLGYYSMSYRILGLPLAVVSNNVSKVFFEEASREYNKTKQFNKTFNKTSLFLCILAIPMVLFMIFLAPPIFKWFFGERWEISGHYVKILAPMFGIRFLVTALSPGMIIAKKQKSELILQVLFVIVSIATYVISKIINTSIYDYLKIISISFSSIYIVYYFALLKYSLSVKTN